MKLYVRQPIFGQSCLSEVGTDRNIRQMSDSEWEHICVVVNSHDSLVAALREIAAQVTTSLLPDGSYTSAVACTVMQNIARKALTVGASPDPATACQTCVNLTDNRDACDRCLGWPTHPHWQSKSVDICTWTLDDDDNNI